MARGWNSARRASVLPWPRRGVLAEALQWNTILSESGSRVDRPSICLGKWNSTRGSSCSVPSKKRSEEHTSELQSHSDLVCRLLLEKKKKKKNTYKAEQ